MKVIDTTIVNRFNKAINRLESKQRGRYVNPRNTYSVPKERIRGFVERVEDDKNLEIKDVQIEK